MITLFILFLTQLGFNFEEGDILFQDCNCGEICEAIEDVSCYNSKNRFSHIAIVAKDNGKLKVIEANTLGVVYTDLDSFINKYHIKNFPSIAVGRLKKKYKKMIPHVTSFCKSKLGFEYDEEYLLNNNKYYCSELIYEAFKSANNNKDFFKLNTMTFKNPNSNEYNKTFVNIYKNLDKEIPEGKLGINPCAIAITNKLHLIKLYK